MGGRDCMPTSKGLESPGLESPSGGAVYSRVSHTGSGVSDLLCLGGYLQAASWHLSCEGEAPAG